ncbi:MAG: PEP-CTERM sorting domain-containing protein [Planctomycetaceae bacterium]
MSNIFVRRVGPLLASLLFSVAVIAARGDTILFVSDLQLSGSPAGQVTQPGWVAQDVTKLSGTTSLTLTPTVGGATAGVTARLLASGNWESRGGTAEGRDPVSGTTFNDVVSDLWVTRTMSFSVLFSGLSTGATYRIRTWHNDSYNINEGFAAGGGTVQLAATGATVVSSTSGTVTNRRGAQTNAAFGIAQMTFIPTIANPEITYTRVGGSITALPVNGVEVTAIVVPEPAMWGLLAIAAPLLTVARRRRHAQRSPVPASRTSAAMPRSSVRSLTV